MPVHTMPGAIRTLGITCGFIGVIHVGLIALSRHLELEAERHTSYPARNSTYESALHSDAAVSRLSHFLTFQTLSDSSTEDHIKSGHHEEFTELLNFMASSFPEVYSTLQVEKVGLEGWSRLFTWKGSKPSLKPILFISHYDVVPVTSGTEKDWTYPPFSGAVADGFIWGRGSLDVKISVMGLLEAVTLLLKAGFQPERTLIFSFGHDEEVGGTGGAALTAAHLLKQGIELEVIIDEGGVIFLDGMKGLTSHPVAIIGTAEKVYTSLLVDLTSPGGHSSMPPTDGTDVAAQAARVIQTMGRYPAAAQLRDPMPDFFKALAPYALPAPRVLYTFSHLWPFKWIIAKVLSNQGGTMAALVRTTTAVTKIQAGVFDNVLPNTGQLSVNMRSHPDVDRKEVVSYLEGIVKRAGVNASVTVSNHSHIGPTNKVTPSSGRHYEALKQAIQEMWRVEEKPVAVAPFLMTGGTDSKHFASLTDHGVLRFVPYRLNRTAGDLGTIHSTNEHVRVEDYPRMILTYTRVMELFGAMGDEGEQDQESMGGGGMREQSYPEAGTAGKEGEGGLGATVKATGEAKAGSLGTKAEDKNEL